MALNVFNSHEGSACIHHWIASLRALVKSIWEQISRFFLIKPILIHLFLKLKDPIIFSSQWPLQQLLSVEEKNACDALFG